MAIVANDPNLQGNEDPNQKDKEPSGGVNVSGSAAGSTGTGGASTGQPATPGATSSGRFQNLQGYLKANQGYNQGQGLAGQVGSTLSGNEATAEQGVENERNRVQTQAQTAASPYQTDTLNQYAQQAYADPTKVNQAEWAKYYQGQYAAPQAYDYNGQLNQSQQALQQQSNLAGSESGRMQLLQQLYGTPGYSAGQQGLDQLLLQSQPGQLGQLQTQAGQLATQLGNAYSGGAGASQGYLDNLKTLAQTGSQTLQSGLGKDISQEQAALTQRAADLQTQRQSQNQADLAALQAGHLTDDQYQALHLTKGMQLYGVDPSKYLIGQALGNGSLGNVGVGNVATDADRAKFQALAQMSGQPGASPIGSFANASTPLSNAQQYDTEALTKAINDAKTKGFDPAYEDIAKQLNSPTHYEGPFGGFNVPSDRGSGTPMEWGHDIGADISALQKLTQPYTQQDPHFNPNVNKQTLAQYEQDSARLKALQDLQNSYLTGKFGRLS